jgi:hypothetical protein
VCDEVCEIDGFVGLIRGLVPTVGPVETSRLTLKAADRLASVLVGTMRPPDGWRPGEERLVGSVEVVVAPSEAGGVRVHNKPIADVRLTLIASVIWLAVTDIARLPTKWLLTGALVGLRSCLVSIKHSLRRLDDFVDGLHDVFEFSISLVVGLISFSMPMYSQYLVLESEGFFYSCVDSEGKAS